MSFYALIHDLINLPIYNVFDPSCSQKCHTSFHIKVTVVVQLQFRSQHQMNESISVKKDRNELANLKVAAVNFILISFKVASFK